MNKNKIILFLVLILGFSITTIFSSWIITNSTRDSTYWDSVTSSNYITITIKYLMNDGIVTTYDEKKPVTEVNNTISQVSIGLSDEDSYNKIYTFCNDNNFKTTKGTQEKIIDGYFYHLDISTDIKTLSLFGALPTYYGEYTLYKQKINTKMTTSTNNDKTHTLSMKSGTNFSYDIAKTIVTKDITNYTFLGFCDSNEKAITSDTIFNNNTEIYAYFNNKNGDGISQNSITDVVQETTDASIYLDNQTDKYNIRLDNSYFSQDNSIRLGNGKKNEVITITKAIKFCLNDGSESKQADIGNKDQICTPFHSSHKCHYKIILDCDLIINGTLLLGGFYGSGSNTHIQSNLREFVCLDLNGHTITVNGTLNSYGFIMDSVGTGEIIVNGTGTLTSIAVIYDYKGGTSTENQNSKNICPFQVYNMPYLQCKTKLIQDSNGWGNFICNISLNPVSSTYGNLPDSLKKSLIQLSVLGDKDGYLFKILSNNNQNGVIEINYIKSSELSSNESIKNSCYDGKLIFTIYNCSIELAYIEMKIATGLTSVTINTVKMNFPISPFMNFNAHNNSSIKIAQKIKLLPGASIYLDKTSSLIFAQQTVDKKIYSGSLSVLETSIYKYNHSNGGLIKNNTYVKDDSAFFINNFWNNTLINKYFGKAKVLCNGTIYFTTGNSESYQLSGLIDFNQLGYIDTNNVNHTITYSLNQNPFVILKDLNCNVKTYAFDFIPGVYGDTGNEKAGQHNPIFYARPLISHNIAYAYDSTNNINIIGEYDINTGILSSNNKTYFFYVNENFSDTTINCYECTINNDHTITYNNQRYAFFGNIFIAINDSNQINVSKFYVEGATVTLAYNNTLYYWYRVS